MPRPFALNLETPAPERRGEGGLGLLVGACVLDPNAAAVRCYKQASTTTLKKVVPSGAL
jgi:hypothetical protein